MCWLWWRCHIHDTLNVQIHFIFVKFETRENKGEISVVIIDGTQYNEFK